MYRRSYEYAVTTEQKEEFNKKVNKIINLVGFYRCLNDYPYDMCRDKKVKTKHITIFYKNIDDMTYHIDTALEEGYSVQINSTEHQSIQEIKHLHFIKTIDD